MNRFCALLLSFLALSQTLSANVREASPEAQILNGIKAGVCEVLARVYDPQTGRFLSADPVIQDPNNLQCYNRYSYCLNNPLVYTDPTGYTVWKPEEKSIPENASEEERNKIESYNAQVRNYLKFLDNIKATKYGAKVYANLDSKKETYAFRAVQNKSGELAGYTVNERTLENNKISNHLVGAVMYEGKVDRSTFMSQVIQPSLDRFSSLSGRNYNSNNAADLLLSTATHESGNFQYRKQVGGGPGRSFYQIESTTFRDVYGRFVSRNRPQLKPVVDAFNISGDLNEELVNNDAFSTIIARLKYSMNKAELPAAGDVKSQADYWFKYYNGSSETERGPRTQKFISDNEQEQGE